MIFFVLYTSEIDKFDFICFTCKENSEKVEQNIMLENLQYYLNEETSICGRRSRREELQNYLGNGITAKNDILWHVDIFEESNISIKINSFVFKKAIFFSR